MSSDPFEFVKTDGSYSDEMVQIKPEPMEYNIYQPEVEAIEVKAFAEPSSTSKSEKCGEIFSSTGGKYILICAFCHFEFNAMEEFGLHVSSKHNSSSNIDSIESPCKETKPLTKPLQPMDNVHMDTFNEIFTKPEEHTYSSSEADDMSDDDPDFYPNESQLKIKSPVDVKMNVEDETSDASAKDDDNQSAAATITAAAEDDKSDDDSDEQKVSCNTCHRKYKTRRGLYRHQKSTGCMQFIKPTNLDLFCVLCQRQLKQKKSFRLHMRRHYAKTEPGADQEDGGGAAIKPPVIEDPALYCDICKRYFKAKSGLLIHAEKIHAGKDDTIPLVLIGDIEFLKCKFCDKEFTDFGSRREHETTHVDTHPYVCGQCGKRFATSQKKATHIMGMHTGERPFSCSQCPNKYISRRDLMRHINFGHLKIKKYQCTMCDRKCFRSTELAIHMRKHTGEKPYVCEDCGNNFATLGQLKSHQLRHTQTKNYKCDQCGRCFYSTTSLKDHQASHSDDKPFGCEICGRRFPRAKALKKHSKLHLDFKSYVCNICGKAYAQDSGLYAHKKSHGLHANPPPPVQPSVNYQ